MLSLLPSESQRCAGETEICQKISRQYPATLLCRARGLLISALAALALGGGAASAYDLATTWYHTCALDDNGVTCWGHNKYGQTTVPAGLVNPSALTAGGHHTCALDDNGVTCWGYNVYGQSDRNSKLRFRNVR